MRNYLLKILVFSFISFSQLLSAQDRTGENPQQSAEELAKKLANPIYSFVDVPFRNNLDFGIDSIFNLAMPINAKADSGIIAKMDFLYSN